MATKYPKAYIVGVQNGIATINTANNIHVIDLQELKYISPLRTLTIGGSVTEDRHLREEFTILFKNEGSATLSVKLQYNEITDSSLKNVVNALRKTWIKLMSKS